MDGASDGGEQLKNCDGSAQGVAGAPVTGSTKDQSHLGSPIKVNPTIQRAPEYDHHRSLNSNFSEQPPPPIFGYGGGAVSELQIGKFQWGSVRIEQTSLNPSKSPIGLDSIGMKSTSRV
ncbi:hypothetical protein HAX54_027458 [Datura stramonium]|uniref:Uncharacterized protein n=1 Tax=Datura stramonium TaxID=4076 RepID=A0ABS8S8U6_DATST|nr:hypothetical protein [Datura stramonium]